MRSNKNIRGDKIMWVDGRETEVSNIKFLMNQVVTHRHLSESTTD